ncbi:hypothetical protein LINGRAHAP2_LOCUS13960, partial [Linum grandiflorum]
MDKSKGKLARIENEAKRIAYMRKLIAELTKEAKELSTLYEVDAMVLVYNGPNDVEPLAVWPPDPTKLIERLNYSETSWLPNPVLCPLKHLDRTST